MTNSASDGAQPRRKGNIFYGWWIVLVGTLAMTFNGGLLFYGFSAFFNPLINEFGWSRASLSGVISISRLESGVAGIIVGPLVDRLGPRKPMLIGLFITGLGFILLSRVNSILMFYIIFVLFLSVGSGLAFGMAIFTAVGNWFRRKRSQAMGITMTGIGLGGFVVPALAWFITQFGWRSAVITAGIIMWSIAIPTALIMRHRPEDMGLVPDGVSPQNDEPTRLVENNTKRRRWLTRWWRPRVIPPEVDYTISQSVHTGAFWLMSLAFGLRMMVVNGIVIHQMPYLLDVGFSRGTAAFLLGAMAVASIPGRLIYGWLGDIFDKRYVTASTFFLMALSLILLMNVTTLWQMIIFLIIYAPPYGGGVPLYPAMQGEYFGRKAFGAIRGASQLITMWGGIAGPFLAGYVFDVTQSYRLAFLIFAVALLISTGLILLAKRPQPQFVTPAAAAEIPADSALEFEPDP
ncbi:MAG: MFS transporter [Chloroflexi bacterium]|nr:MFS transporter [Chloroflexota bacterium]